ncbi:unnamed protein product, partial [marine sediment metagenome]
MQTYTHLAIGVLVGTACFPDNSNVVDVAARITCMAGSVAPDLVLAP